VVRRLLTNAHPRQEEATMFRRRSPRPDTKADEEQAPERFTYVHVGTTVHGALEATGRVRIDGRVLGTVRVDGTLEIAEGGLVEGATVDASEVRVLGTVRASVRATEKVEIWRGGTIEGDVTTPALDVEEGGTLHGRTDMLVAPHVLALGPAAARDEHGAPALAAGGSSPTAGAVAAVVAAAEAMIEPRAERPPAGSEGGEPTSSS
jgi:cytoskeletal protein CcmA (bactofilin family)